MIGILETIWLGTTNHYYCCNYYYYIKKLLMLDINNWNHLTQTYINFAWTRNVVWKELPRVMDDCDGERERESQRNRCCQRNLMMMMWRHVTKEINSSAKVPSPVNMKFLATVITSVLATRSICMKQCLTKVCLVRTYPKNVMIKTINFIWRSSLTTKCRLV